MHVPNNNCCEVPPASSLSTASVTAYLANDEVSCSMKEGSDSIMLSCRRGARTKAIGPSAPVDRPSLDHVGSIPL